MTGIPCGRVVGRSVDDVLVELSERFSCLRQANGDAIGGRMFADGFGAIHDAMCNFLIIVVVSVSVLFVNCVAAIKGACKKAPKWKSKAEYGGWIFGTLLAVLVGWLPFWYGNSLVGILIAPFLGGAASYWAASELIPPI